MNTFFIEHLQCLLLRVNVYQKKDRVLIERVERRGPLRVIRNTLAFPTTTKIAFKIDLVFSSINSRQESHQKFIS